MQSDLEKILEKKVRRMSEEMTYDEKTVQAIKDAYEEKLAEQIKQFEEDKKKALDEQQERHIKELKELILGRETKPKEESEELSYEDVLMAKIRQKIKK